MRDLAESRMAQQVFFATDNDADATATIIIPADEYGVLEWLSAGLDAAVTTNVLVKFGGSTGDIVFQAAVAPGFNHFNFGPGGLYEPTRTKGRDIYIDLTGTGTSGNGFISWKVK